MIGLVNGVSEVEKIDFQVFDVLFEFEVLFVSVMDVILFNFNNFVGESKSIVNL